MSQVFPINADPRFRIYTAEAGQVAFPVPFPWQDNDDITILRTDLDGVTTTLNEAEHYQLTGAGDVAGGTMTLNEGEEALEGEEFLVLGDASLVRVSSIVQGGRFRYQGTDNDLDRLTLIAQEIHRELGRTLRTAYGVAGAEVEVGGDNRIPLWWQGKLIPGPLWGETVGIPGPGLPPGGMPGQVPVRVAGPDYTTEWQTPASSANLVTFDPTGTGLSSGDVQAALEELDEDLSVGLSLLDGEKVDKAGDVMTGPLGFTHQGSPANPAAGRVSLFARNDNRFYTRTSAGQEQAISRERLTAPLALYVRMDGSDTNDGRADTSGGAVLTIQKAVDLAKLLDSNGFDVTITVRAGTRTVGAIVDGPLVGGGAVNIIGDVATPSNCVINTTSADCFFYTNNARGTVRGFQTTTTTSGACLKAYLGAYVLYGSMIFGACAGMHIDVGTESKVIAAYSYTISGGAVGHFHTGNPCTVSSFAITVTLTGTPAFAAYFAGTAGGYQALGSITFVGSATGKRYLAHKNGTIDVNTTSETFLPGSIAGTTESGGKYCGDVTSADIIGNLGTTDNALLRADGTGGVNAQGSAATLSDNAVLSLSSTTQFNPQVAVNAEYSGTTAGYINFQKGRASGPVSSGDDIGTFVGQARDTASTFRNAASFSFVVAAAPAAGSVDGRILFNTTQSAAAATRMTIGQGLLVGAATGGDKGAGTVNATAVYDDNTLLTCIPLQEEFLARGEVDIAKWDALAPDLVIPEHVQREPATFVYQQQQLADVVEPDELGRLVRRRVEQNVERQLPLVWAEPVYDEVGNIVDAIETPIFDEVCVPEKVIPRVHGTARLFAQMLAEGFDPRDPVQYIAKLQADHALPGMPTRETWEHNALSSGELFNRLWLATEMLAILAMNLHSRVRALEHR